jgi:23S rRNA (pseudouridine1915-N3)-methyltransferase
MLRVTICAVGRLRAGPELDLTTDWLDRYGKSGRALGLGPARLAEVEARGGRTAEAAALARAVPEGAALCCLDERGRMLTSPDFAATLAGWRDAGRAEAAFVIGGADGIDPELRQRADLLLSFGPMVWPHMLVRVMLAEQLYRAAQILAGTPYHRA